MVAWAQLLHLETYRSLRRVSFVREASLGRTLRLLVGQSILPAVFSGKRNIN